jgi:hypothetical protein
VLHDNNNNNNNPLFVCVKRNLIYPVDLRRHEPEVLAVYGELQALHTTFFVSGSYSDEPVAQCASLATGIYIYSVITIRPSDKQPSDKHDQSNN